MQSTAYQLDLWLHAKHNLEKQRHIQKLHGKSSNLAFLYRRRSQEQRYIKEMAVMPGHELPAWVKEYASLIECDSFVTQNRFLTSIRRTSNVADLGACFADIDFHHTYQYEQLAPDKVYSDIQFTLEEAGIPEPSFAIFTGRGLCLVWLLQDGITAEKLGLWSNIQNLIYDALRDYGSDPMARDAARILRIIGSINSKSGKRVEAFDGNNAIFTLEDFPTPATKPAATDEEIQIWNAKLLWGRRQRDLLNLPEAFGGLIPVGIRHNWLVLVYNGFAWLGARRYWQREKPDIIAKVAGEYNIRDLHSTLRTLDRRLNEPIAWGQGLYRFRTRTIREWLDIDIDFCMRHGLYSLAGSYWLQGEENTEYQRYKRRKYGRPDRRGGLPSLPRAEYLQEARASADWEKRSRILELRAQGLSFRKIGKMLNIDHSRVVRLFHSL